MLLLALLEGLVELAVWGVQTCCTLRGAGFAAVSQTWNLSGNVRHRGGAVCLLCIPHWCFCLGGDGVALLWFVTEGVPELHEPSCPVCKHSVLAANMWRLLFMFPRGSEWCLGHPHFFKVWCQSWTLGAVANATQCGRTSLSSWSVRLLILFTHVALSHEGCSFMVSVWFAFGLIDHLPKSKEVLGTRKSMWRSTFSPCAWMTCREWQANSVFMLGCTYSWGSRQGGLSQNTLCGFRACAFLYSSLGSYLESRHDLERCALPLLRGQARWSVWLVGCSLKRWLFDVHTHIHVSLLSSPCVSTSQVVTVRV